MANGEGDVGAKVLDWADSARVPRLCGFNLGFPVKDDDILSAKKPSLLDDVDRSEAEEFGGKLFFRWSWNRIALGVEGV